MATPWKAYGRYGTVGLELILSIAIAWIVGHFLDAKFFPGKWYCTLVFTIGGVYTGFRALYKTAKRLERETEEMDREEAALRKKQLDEAIVRDKLDRVEKEILSQEKREEKREPS